MSAGISFDAAGLMKGLSDYDQKRKHTLEVYGRSSAQKMLGYAKKNARWKDHSGSDGARGTMTDIAEWDGDKFIVGVQGNKHYSVYLEFVNFTHKGRLSILQPTIDHFKADIYKGLAGLLSK